MISVSSNYKTNATKPVRNINAKISIGAVDFGIDNIVSFELSRSPSDGGLSVGGTVAARLTATIRATMLPTMDDYKVTVFIGFTALAQIGTFFITDLTQEKGYVTIEAYDRFYYLDKPCSFNGSADGKVESLSFPATHQEMLEYISKINGFSLSVTCEAFAKVKTKPIYNSEATNPTNKYYTYREIIGFIAACNGCNAQFDANDKLIFTRPSNSVETIEEGACESLSVAQDSGFTVKGIRFTIGTDTAFYIDANGTAYDETLPGVLEAVNPLATVEIMEYVWNKLGGYHYYAADISRRGRGWLLPDDVISIKSNGATKKVTITAISYSLSKDSGFSEQITSTAESTEQSSNRYSAAGDHTSNVGAGKYNSTTIINDPVIISEKTKEYLKYDYSIIGYSVDDKITYGLDGGNPDIIVQGYKAAYDPGGLGALCGNFNVVNGIYGATKVYATPFTKLSFYLKITQVVQYEKYTIYYINLISEYTTKDGKTTKKVESSVRARHGNFSPALKWQRIYPPSAAYPNGYAEIHYGINFHNDMLEDSQAEKYTFKYANDAGVSFSSIAEYNAAIRLTRSTLEKKDINQTVSKIVEAGGTADFPELGENDVLYIDSTDNSAYKWSSKISAYYCVGRDYFSIKQIHSVADPNSSEAEILEAQLLQDMRSPTEWTLHASFVPPKGYMCITDFEGGQHGIKIGDGNTPWSELLYVNIYDLSAYLKSDEISNWAKADEKPKYTAADVGAATSADITAAVEAVSIGGRNIACGTKIMTPGANYTGNWNDGTWRSNKSWGVLSVVDITDSPVEGVTKAIRLTANKVENGCGVSQQFTPLVAGQQYVLSCWVRGTAPIAQISTYYSTPVKGRVAPFNITSQWQKVFVDCGNTEQYNVPTETKAYTASIVYIVPKNIGDYVEICGLKLEKGNKPTDWSPAPEDTDRRITSLEARVAALEAAAVSGGEV